MPFSFIPFGINETYSVIKRWSAITIWHGNNAFISALIGIHT